MVSRLAYGLPIFLFIQLILGCATKSGLPLTVTDFCTVTAQRLPLKISRRDTPETIKQAVTLNYIHAELCLNGEKPQN